MIIGVKRAKNKQMNSVWGLERTVSFTDQRASKRGEKVSGCGRNFKQGS